MTRSSNSPPQQRQYFGVWVSICVMAVVLGLTWLTQFVGTPPHSDRIDIPIVIMVGAALVCQSRWLSFDLRTRGEVAAYNLVDLVTIVGVLFVPPAQMVPALLACGVLVDVAHYRLPAVKTLFNSLNTGVRYSTMWLLLSIFPAVDVVSPAGWPIVALVVMAGGMISDGLFGFAVASVGGQPAWATIRDTAVRSAPVNAGFAAQSLVLASLLAQEPWAVVLFASSIGLFLAATHEYVDEASRRESAEERAMIDVLTGAANRSALADALEVAGPAAAVAYVDLDGFKGVNDTFGHRVGDGVLIETAQRLASVARAEDLVVRLGGDEFVVFFAVADDLDPLRRRLIDVMNQPFNHDTEVLPVGGSVGVVRCDPDESGDDLLARADRAMYSEKAKRKQDRGSAASVPIA